MFISEPILLFVYTMAFSLMVPERITILIRSLTMFTQEDSFDLTVRVSCMSSGIILIVELFSTLSAAEPTSSVQNLAAKSYNFRLFYVKNFFSNIYYINFDHYCTKTVLIILSFKNGLVILHSCITS